MMINVFLPVLYKGNYKPKTNKRNIFINPIIKPIINLFAGFSRMVIVSTIWYGIVQKQI